MCLIQGHGAIILLVDIQVLHQSFTEEILKGPQTSGQLSQVTISHSWIAFLYDDVRPVDIIIICYIYIVIDTIFLSILRNWIILQHIISTPWDAFLKKLPNRCDTWQKHSQMAIGIIRGRKRRRWRGEKEERKWRGEKEERKWREEKDKEKETKKNKKENKKKDKLKLQEAEEENQEIKNKMGE